MQPGSRGGLGTLSSSARLRAASAPLHVLHVVELVRQGVGGADGDDLPVQLAVVDHRVHAQRLHLRMICVIARSAAASARLRFSYNLFRESSMMPAQLPVTSERTISACGGFNRRTRVQHADLILCRLRPALTRGTTRVRSDRGACTA